MNHEVWIVIFLILGAVTAIVMLLHGIRPRWKSTTLLALAGVASGFLVIVAKFEPVQHTVFPFRYETNDNSFGQQIWNPHDAPEWLLSLAARGQIVEIPGTAGNGSMISMMRSSGLSGVANYDPNLVSGRPGAEPHDPNTAPQVTTYQNTRALLDYAFGHPGQNAPQQGIPLLICYGGISAIFFPCLRRMYRSARMRAALARVDRARILVRASWWSVAWPAAAVLAHTFFFDLNSSRYFDLLHTTKFWNGVIPEDIPRPSPLKLALGRTGVGTIWLGTILGSILTFYCVALRAATRQADSSDAEIICDACGYPVADPHDRCPECGTPRETNTPNRRNLWLRTHTLIVAALWVLVGLLLCAPLTLPLLGALLPSPVVDAIGQFWYQLPWATEIEVVPLLLP